MISHSKKFIFVPIRRGAGTSIIRALSKFSDSYEDIQKFNRGVLSDGLSEGVNYGHWQVPSGYRVVTVCRNPWTKVVSAFRMYRNARLNNKGGFWLSEDPTLQEFIEKLPSREEDFKVWIHTQCTVSELLTDPSGKFVAGTVIRFENLHEDFDSLCRNLGLGKISLPHRNDGRLPLSEQMMLHDDFSRDWVAATYAADIERFGYTFPESSDV